MFSIIKWHANIIESCGVIIIIRYVEKIQNIRYISYLRTYVRACNSTVRYVRTSFSFFERRITIKKNTGYRTVPVQVRYRTAR